MNIKKKMNQSKIVFSPFVLILNQGISHKFESLVKSNNFGAIGMLTMSTMQ